MEEQANRYFSAVTIFFRKLNPIVTTLILMLVISVPITLVSSALDKGIDRYNQQSIEDSVKDKKLSYIAYDWVIKTPFKEELIYRSPIALVTLLRNIKFLKAFIALENPLIFCLIIFPGLIWSQGHAVPYAALFDSILLGLLVFKIGGLRGWLSSFLIHLIINFSVFIGFAIHYFLK